ncbi:MAG: hypothetical protein ABJO02_09420 [Reichenbachiella sp.]|uniref:hypothetical protein n=1 Tax=Reichenbachiella sp. TaxID=2184521 RepID=UPI0032995F25
MNENTDQRLCSECERPLFGRTDKKFCSDACRNSYNNRVNADATNFVRNVNNALRKNRRILLELKNGEGSKVHRDQLLRAGFDFDYHTNIRETQSGDMFYYCYDLGYQVLTNGEVLLVAKPED